MDDSFGATGGAGETLGAAGAGASDGATGSLTFPSIASRRSKSATEPLLLAFFAPDEDLSILDIIVMR